jgi:hypothetical protein
LPRSAVQIALLVLSATFVAVGAPAQRAANQKSSAAGQEAVVNSVRIVYDQGTPVVEVVATQPVVPTIQMLDSPPRLVIDLPHSRMGLQRKRIPILKENILTIRAEQYQIEPAITRVVVDLLVPCAYTWDAAGNRVMVRLKQPESPTTASKEASAQPQSVTSLMPAAAGVAVPVTNGVGEFVAAGKAFADGSSLTAGSDTAVLRLTRGGEVHVCPGTTVSVTPAKGSKNLMLGLSTGSLETHYTLKDTADTVLTPDFRILFAGPGEFHYAVSADDHGNTCVRGLRGNTAAAIVYEIMGDRVYQVKPSEQLVFHSGSIDKVDGDVPSDCGCPPPPVVQANPSQVAGVNDPAGSNLTLATGNSSPPASANADGNAASDQVASKNGETLSSGPETRPLPPSQPNDVHLQVEAPLVFHGNEKNAAEPAATAAPAAPQETPAAPPHVDAQIEMPPAAAPDIPAAPPPAAKPEHRGVLRRIKGFFASLFH